MIVIGVIGEQLIPVVSRWVFDFYGSRIGEIGFVVVLGLTQLAVNLLLPLGIAMLAGSLAVRALEPAHPNRSAEPQAANRPGMDE